ncbi:MAG: methionyl-tRNA formyltransferase, partial [Methylobacteriaceae bacterium]
MRVVFMGTPDFAVPTLARLAGDGHTIAAVYTRAPARAGRGMALRPSPVQVMAESLGAPVLTPVSLKG